MTKRDNCESFRVATEFFLTVEVELHHAIKLLRNFKMESTANKIYEIEDSAIMDQGLKSNIDEDLAEDGRQGKFVGFLFISGRGRQVRGLVR